MPVVFDEIDTEITPERRDEPEPASNQQEAPQHTGEFVDRVRTALHMLEARRARLVAD